MFDRLIKVFSRGPTRQNSPNSKNAPNEVSDWAAAQGFLFAAGIDGSGFTVTGKIGNKAWRLERGSASRDYIHGEELRAKAELRLNEEVSVVIMNRALKDALEKRAYEMYTDTLQTIADPSLPEEMRWLAMYPEVGWDSLAPDFWKRYSVMAEKREHALAWLDPHLAQLLLHWPEPTPHENVPFLLMILRGKAYLRMQYTPSGIPTLAHATKIFTHACEQGVSALKSDILV